jgi:hypothetical protein
MKRMRTKVNLIKEGAMTSHNFGTVYRSKRVMPLLAKRKKMAPIHEINFVTNHCQSSLICHLLSLEDVPTVFTTTLSLQSTGYAL